MLQRGKEIDPISVNLQIAMTSFFLFYYKHYNCHYEESNDKVISLGM